MEKQLLIDVLTFEPQRQILTESLSGSGPFIVKGVLQRANSKNQNGRIYPRYILEKEVDKYVKNFINERRAVGELDHPQDAVVNLKNVSHNIIELHWEGDDLVGSIEILPTPSGNILKELFKSNIRLGVSSRSMGTLKELSEGTSMVNDDLDLICWDYVSNPSVQGAFTFPSAPLTEGIVKKSFTNKWTPTENIIQNIFSELN